MTVDDEPPIRVVVVEDSLVQRVHLMRVLEADGDIVVVGQASCAGEAVQVVADERPDVVTLDLNLPDRSGIFVIEQIMAHAPTAIVVLSASVVSGHSGPAVEALVAGALDALPKPVAWTHAEEAYLRRSVRSLHKVPVRGRRKGAPVRQPPAKVAVGLPVVALAASTGGPAALAQVLAGLGGLRAAVLVVQHLHPDFVAGLVEWMARVSALPVELAVQGRTLVPGRVYIGPGDVHIRLGAGRRVVLDPEPPSVHRPSADELFASLAEHAGPSGVGVIMTGMGQDGAAGLLALRRRGGRTLAQDEATCAVFGMPQAADRLGAVNRFVPLAGIPAAVVRAVREQQA